MPRRRNDRDGRTAATPGHSRRAHTCRRRASWLASVILALGAAGVNPPSAQAQLAPERFTLEQIVGAPRTTALVASPAGRAIAWAVTAEGRSNVWVADGPTLRARQLTTHKADDGQAAEDMTFTPDGRAVVFVRGASSSRNSENTLNPTSAIAPPAASVWIAPLDGTAPTRLGSGRWPDVSPRGDLVTFIRDGQIWAAPVTGAAPERQLCPVRGRVSEVTWAPDGSALAFTVTRGAYAYIGVFRIGSSTVEYVSPGVDRDQAPRWSPDGRQIAFHRIWYTQGSGPNQGRFGGRTSTWSVMVATRPAPNAEFGAAVDVWQSPQTAIGSMPRILRPILEWVEGGRVAFASEHEGWTHLYAADPARPGAAAIALTSGACEIDQAVASVDRRSLFYESNCGDLDRRHIWQVAVPVGGGTAAVPTSLAPGTSIDVNPLPLADGRSVVFQRSDARTPPMPWVVTLADGKVGAVAPQLLPPSFPASHLVEPKPVVVKTTDGLEIHTAVFEPSPGTPSLAGGRRPAVIEVHSGPNHEHEMLGWGWSHEYEMNQYLASRGVVVAAVNMRGGVGFGRAFREPTGTGPDGAAEYQDVLAAVEYLRARSDVDPAHIGIYGISHGGYLTYQALARNSNLFAAGVAHAGIYDLAQRVGATGEAARGAREVSPMGFIDKWRSPVLIIHSDNDGTVDFSQTMNLVRALRARNVPHELLIIPDEGHFYMTYAHLLRDRHATATFFERTLGAAKR